MTRRPAVFYFDLASPYAYLAAARIDAALGGDSIWRPVLVGAIHKRYRRTSWGATPQLRAAGVAEIEARAGAYGLPPVVWPEPYPANSLIAMRAAVWADGRGRVREFARCAFAAAFRRGVDLSERHAVLAVAREAGLEASELDVALDTPALKRALRSATEPAIEAGVFGVPTFDAGGLLWWGGHVLDAAAQYRWHPPGQPR